MGIGMALHEELLYDPRSGQPLTAGLLRRIASRRTATRPKSKSMFIESDDGYGPFGAKSMGESGKVPAVAAVGNAIFNATGRRMKDLPITRDKILVGRSHESLRQSQPARSRAGGDADRSRRAADGRQRGDSPAAAATCSGMVKERIVTPDVSINLRAIKGLDQVTPAGGGREHRRPDHARRAQPASADPARLRRAGRSGRKRGDAADPQRRHAGRQRVPAPLVLVFPQRVPVLQGRRQHVLFDHRREPVSRDFRRRPELHRPSVGHRARAGGAGREVPHRGPHGRAHGAGGGFLRSAAARTPRGKMSLADDEVLASIELPAARPGTRSTYHKVLDREAWTHAVVSAAVVLEMDKTSAEPRASCWEASLRFRGACPRPRSLLAGQRITPELAAKAGEAAGRGARAAREERVQGAADEGGRSAHGAGARGARVEIVAFAIPVQPCEPSRPTPAQNPPKDLLAEL